MCNARVVVHKSFMSSHIVIRIVPRCLLLTPYDFKLDYTGAICLQLTGVQVLYTQQAEVAGLISRQEN